MVIDKILNNNVVLSHNAAGEEIILMGRGLAFQKKAGDPIETDFVEKEFVLKDSLTGQQMTQLFYDLPSEEIEVVKKIIQLAEEQLQVELSTNIFLTLTDHVHYAIVRTKENIEMPNPLLMETQRFYPKEFAVALNGLDLIEEELGIRLPTAEAGFITFHLVNSNQGNDNMQTTMQMTEMVRDIISLISRYFGKTFDTQALNYQRLVTHLQYFSQRFLNNELSDEKDEFLFALVQSKYPAAFQAVRRIDMFLQKAYQKPLGQAEMIYLTIHIERVVANKTNN